MCLQAATDDDTPAIASCTKNLDQQWILKPVSWKWWSRCRVIDNERKNSSALTKLLAWITILYSVKLCVTSRTCERRDARISPSFQRGIDIFFIFILTEPGADVFILRWGLNCTIEKRKETNRAFISLLHSSIFNQYGRLFRIRPSYIRDPISLIIRPASARHTLPIPLLQLLLLSNCVRCSWQRAIYIRNGKKEISTKHDIFATRGLLIS